jgi:hypothetical protein
MQVTLVLACLFKIKKVGKTLLYTALRCCLQFCSANSRAVVKLETNYKYTDADSNTLQCIGIC